MFAADIWLLLGGDQEKSENKDRISIPRGGYSVSSMPYISQKEYGAKRKDQDGFCFELPSASGVETGKRNYYLVTTKEASYPRLSFIPPEETTGTPRPSLATGAAS